MFPFQWQKDLTLLLPQRFQFGERGEALDVVKLNWLLDYREGGGVEYYHIVFLSMGNISLHDFVLCFYSIFNNCPESHQMGFGQFNKLWQRGHTHKMGTRKTSYIVLGPIFQQCFSGTEDKSSRCWAAVCRNSKEVKLKN